MSFQLDSKTWAEQQFERCKLGDQRRTRRLINVAEQVVNNPSASIPEQVETWGDTKAAYRLFDAEDVTFQAIVQPHWEQTRSCTPGRYLVLGDTTEISFGHNPHIKGLSRIGNGSNSGFLLHNALLVDVQSETVLGLAGQTIHYRKPAPKKESQAQRLKRQRESKVWGDVIDQVGLPGEGVELVHVFDRGGDDFEVFCHLLQNRVDWVVRVSSLQRLIITPDGEKVSVKEHLGSLSIAGEYELELRARPGQPARTARMEVRHGDIRMPLPKHRSPYVKAMNPDPIPMHVVWVREVDAPAGAAPIEWVLYTSLPVTSFSNAWEVIRYYECRWLVEEFHKALKTGCSVEHRKLRKAARLEPMVGLMSVVAVRLLQLKLFARSDPNRPARTIVPPLWLQMLKAARKKLSRVHDMTIYQFYRELAKLGGFLGRKGDGEPGWITVWRGWEKLNMLVRGAELAATFKKCG